MASPAQVLPGRSRRQAHERGRPRRTSHPMADQPAITTAQALLSFGNAVGTHRVAVAGSQRPGEPFEVDVLPGQAIGGAGEAVALNIELAARREVAAQGEPVVAGTATRSASRPATRAAPARRASSTSAGRRMTRRDARPGTLRCSRLAEVVEAVLRGDGGEIAAHAGIDRARLADRARASPTSAGASSGSSRAPATRDATSSGTTTRDTATSGTTATSAGGASRQHRPAAR